MRYRRIYLASSWRNEHYPHVLALLRRAGHEVYDFRHPQRVHGLPPLDGAAYVAEPLRLGAEVASGFGWREVDPDWETWTPAEYVAGLGHPRAEEGFRSDFNGMRWADTCVLLLPSGPSAAIGAGWCRGSGRDLVVHVAGLREPDLMYKLGRRLTLTDRELLQALEEDPAEPAPAPTRFVDPDPDLPW